MDVKLRSLKRYICLSYEICSKCPLALSTHAVVYDSSDQLLHLDSCESRSRSSALKCSCKVVSTDEKKTGTKSIISRFMNKNYIFGGISVKILASEFLVIRKIMMAYSWGPIFGHST